MKLIVLILLGKRTGYENLVFSGSAVSGEKLIENTTLIKKISNCIRSVKLSTSRCCPKLLISCKKIHKVKETNEIWALMIIAVLSKSRSTNTFC